MNKKILIITSSLLLLTGCQVTGEQNNLYQKVLSYSGQSTKSDPLNGAKNRFSIIVPKSSVNETTRFKGLVSNQNYFSSLARSQYFDHIWKRYYSSLRSLSDTTTKLRICNSTFAEDRRQPSSVSNSCSEVTLKTHIKDMGSAYQINFEGINVDQHQQSFALSKIEVPNVYSSVGVLDQNLLKSTFGYYDRIEFKSKLKAEQLAQKLGHQFGSVQIYKDNGEIYLQVNFDHEYRVDQAVSPINCKTNPTKPNVAPIVRCDYAIFSAKGISDYRQNKIQTENFIKKVFLN